MEQTVNPIRRDDTTSGMATESRFGAASAEVGAARYYDEIFVPALFAQWVAPLAQEAGVAPGEGVLDVACGSGIVARELLGSLQPPPLMSGIDLAPGMLAVAAARTPRADWRQGDASALPYADASFDRVLCQFGLMFFGDRIGALGEMLRVLRPAGRLAIAVWDSLENNPGFARKVRILERLAGDAAAEALRAPFCLGARDALIELVERAGVRDPVLHTRAGQARFASLRQFVDAELRGWLPVMGVNLDDDLIEAIYRECERDLGAYLGGDAFSMPVSAYLVSGGARGD